MIKDTCSDPDSRFRMVQEHVLQACKDPVSASFGLQTDQQAHRARTLPLILTLTSTPIPLPTPTLTRKEKSAVVAWSRVMLTVLQQGSST